LVFEEVYRRVKHGFPEVLNLEDTVKEDFLWDIYFHIGAII
jgi:hypothetical protein